MAVKSIVLEIKGKNVTLTLEEARSLYNDLNGLFNNATGTSITLPWITTNGDLYGPTYATNGVEFPTASTSDHTTKLGVV